jgi:hypothetical protein
MLILRNGLLNMFFKDRLRKRLNILLSVVSLLIEFGLVAINFQMYRVVSVQIMGFWVVTQHSLIDGYECCGECVVSVFRVKLSGVRM